MNPDGPVMLLGDLNVDVMLPLPNFPRPGYESWSEEIYVCPGGSIANSAFVLAGLGIPVGLISKTGEDLWGQFERQKLEQAGVNLSWVSTSKSKATGLASIVVLPDGERTMFSHRGANRDLSPDDISIQAISEARLLHISGYAFSESPQREAAWRAVEIAEQHQVPISLDTALQPVLMVPDQMRRVLGQVTIAILGEVEGRAMYGDVSLDEILDILLAGKTQVAAIKLGSQGARLASRSERQEFPIFPVATVDSTGAGDSFSAGLIYAYLRGLDVGPSGVIASALGALATRVWGGGSELPDRASLVTFMQQLTQTELDPQIRAWVQAALIEVTS